MVTRAAYEREEWRVRVEGREGGCVMYDNIVVSLSRFAA